MNAESFKRWELVRAIGVWRFTLVHGVMAYGMSTTVALLVILEWVAIAMSATLPPDPHRVAKFALIGILGGVGFALLFWREMERKYARAVERRASDGAMVQRK